MDRQIFQVRFELILKYSKGRSEYDFFSTFSIASVAGRESVVTGEDDSTSRCDSNLASDEGHADV